MEFQELIAQLKNDCKKYQFCEEGVDGIDKSKSALQCCAFLRENIVYCFDSEYHEVIADNIGEWYRQWKKEFNSCGIWVNECPSNGNGILILVEQNLSRFKSQQWLKEHAKIIIGNCRCFIFGDKKMRVLAYSQVRIYSKNPNAHIILYDHSHGFIRMSEVAVCNTAICYAENSKVYLYDRCQAHLTESCHVVSLSSLSKVDTIEHIGFQ